MVYSFFLVFYLLVFATFFGFLFLMHMICFIIRVAHFFILLIRVFPDYLVLRYINTDAFKFFFGSTTLRTGLGALVRLLVVRLFTMFPEVTVL